MQPVDFTTLTAACCELRTGWLPARLEQVHQRDRYTVCLGLRTLDQRGWLTISWHPQAARLCIGDPPPRTSETFAFSQQIRHQIGGLALTAIEAIAPWERVLDLQFARRPGEPALWHLYAEVMGKYSNLILTNQENLIVTAAHQVSAQQSSVRPIQTGQPYEAPPSLTESAPTLSETQTHWQQRISLVPGPLRRNLLTSYRGLSSALVLSMLRMASLDPNQSTDTLSQADWQRLFTCWQSWLQALTDQQFKPGWLPVGYTVLGWESVKHVPDTQTLLNCYYTGQLSRQEFSQLRHQISQKLSNLSAKLRLKAHTFQERLHQVARADETKKQADLLMAHLQDWQPGMQAIALPDFDTGRPTTIGLNPEKTAIQNAQALYKQHQKLKRARVAIQPLLAAVNQEIQYLEQVEAAVHQVDAYRNPADLHALEEIRDELVQQQYLVAPDYRSPVNQTTDFLRYRTLNGFELLVGRNNRQNDQLTFRLAGPHDLWFHAQEISGSHVLLRLEPGTVPDLADLQFGADFAAYYSRSRQSKQVPVVYTEPRYVYKPKGAKPGMAIYKQEQVIWGSPERVMTHLIQRSE